MGGYGLLSPDCKCLSDSITRSTVAHVNEVLYVITMVVINFGSLTTLFCSTPESAPYNFVSLDFRLPV